MTARNPLAGSTASDATSDGDLEEPGLRDGRHKGTGALSLSRREPVS